MQLRSLVAIGAGILLAIAFLQSGSAADRPEGSSWTGLYVGGDVGGSFASTKTTTLDPPYSWPFQSFTLRGSSISGGPHIGYNWQASSNWAIGVEGDANWVNLRGSASDYKQFSSGFRNFEQAESVSTSVTWLASLRGRAGYTANKWLFYLTGGGAFAGFQRAATQRDAMVGVVSAIWPFSNSSISSGWVTGGGLEYAYDAHWRVRCEYLYYSLNGANGAASPINTGHGTFVNDFIDTFDRTIVQTVRVGVSYRFRDAFIEH